MGALIPAFQQLMSTGGKVSVQQMTMQTTKAGPAQKVALPNLLFFVIDTSGSMAGSKLEAAKAAIRTMANSARPEDFLALTYFSDRWYFGYQPKRKGGAPGKSCEAFDTAVTALKAEGGTQLWESVGGAVATVRLSTDKTNHLIILMDGQDNDSQGHVKHGIAEAFAHPGGRIHLHFIAIGSPSEINEPLLRSLLPSWAKLVIDNRGDAAAITRAFQMVQQQIQQITVNQIHVEVKK